MGVVLQGVGVVTCTHRVKTLLTSEAVRDAISRVRE